MTNRVRRPGLAAAGVPDVVPVLSRGRHRSPAEGGCFMEFASWLAGERWSDHPACTHPLVAALARRVNDAMSAHGRGRLAPLVPMVIGLDGDDPRLDAVVARRCALFALPRARADDRRALAAGLLTAERMLARLEDRPIDDLTDPARTALDAVPDARGWVVDVARRDVPRLRPYRRQAAPTAVRCAVEATLASRPADPDGDLVDLFEAVVTEARAFVRRPVTPVDAERWSAACDLLAASST